jgi:hypothetical protein
LLPRSLLEQFGVESLLELSLFVIFALRDAYHSRFRTQEISHGTTTINFKQTLSEVLIKGRESPLSNHFTFIIDL